MKTPSSKSARWLLLLALVASVSALLLLRTEPRNSAPNRAHVAGQGAPSESGQAPGEQRDAPQNPSKENRGADEAPPLSVSGQFSSKDDDFVSLKSEPRRAVGTEIAARERYSNPEEEDEARPDQPDEAERWRLLRMIDERGVIPHRALLNAWEHARNMPINLDAWTASPRRPKDASVGGVSANIAGIQPSGWTWLGPGNIGGRIRSIVIHPTTPQTMWVGSVGGGMWKTVNSGTSWTAVNDFMANLSIGSMAMDPTNPNVIYAGTGEGYSNSDSLRGAGIFKTTDGGTTWAQLPSTSSSSWYYVNRIAINPSNSQILLAATNTGIWRSTDGGSTWSQRVATTAFDIEFNPTDSSKCIASGLTSVRYSTDGGVTWTAATGIPTSGRVEIAYARSNPSIVYASANSNSGEIYRSADGGQTYTLASTGQNYLGSQGWYDNALWVDPTNPNIVIVGGIDLWRSTDGGTTLTRISRWQNAPNSAHADHHVIVESPQFNGSTNKTVFFGNDGGIYLATDVYSVVQTSGWTELNNNLGVTQFYGGAGNPTSGRIVGGTQDNGTLRYTGATETWDMPFGGDGGWCASDPTDPNYFYGEYVRLQIHRSTNGGLFSNYIYAGITDAEQSTANFIAPFILDPNDPNTLLGGGASLWRSTNVKAPTPTWAAIKDPTGSNISAIAVAKGNSNIIWVGHNNGDVYFTTNGTATAPTWTRADLGSPALPNRFCTRIWVDPTNSNRVYVTFGGFSPDNVWRTDNNGAAWTNATGNLPSAPVYTLVVWQQNPNYLYVGTEVGVFASADGGQTWSPSNDGPSNCSVDELFWMNNTLIAATHGRGMFSIPIVDSGCSYGISPTPQSFAAGGGTGTFTVTSGPACAWTATSNATWITINSGASGTGSGTAGFTVAANTSTSARSGTVTVSGQSFTGTVTINQAGSNPTTQVQTNPAGRSFTVDGTTYTTAQTFSWTPGTSHTISTTSPQSGATGVRYVWGNWSDGGAISHTVTASSVNTTYTAGFFTQYLLTMNAGTGGTVTPASGYFTIGQSVSITATPNSSFTFNAWTGSGTDSYTGSANPVLVTMNGPVTETASFSQLQLRLDSLSQPAGRATGGQQIKLAGAFAGLLKVMLGGTDSTWSYSNGTSEITVTTPAHSVGAVSVDLVPSTGNIVTRVKAFAYLATVFTDNTLVAGVTTAKAQHILELRQSVDALRGVAGLAAATWTDPDMPAGGFIKVVHIQELRTYLEEAATKLGFAPFQYTEPTLGIGSTIKRIHIEELRQRIRNIAG